MDAGEGVGSATTVPDEAQVPADRAADLENAHELGQPPDDNSAGTLDGEDAPSGNDQVSVVEQATETDLSNDSTAGQSDAVAVGLQAEHASPTDSSGGAGIEVVEQLRADLAIAQSKAALVGDQNTNETKLLREKLTDVSYVQGLIASQCTPMQYSSD